MQEKFSFRDLETLPTGLYDAKCPAGNVLREIFAVKPGGGGWRELTKIDPRETRAAKIRRESTVTSR